MTIDCIISSSWEYALIPLRKEDDGTQSEWPLWPFVNGNRSNSVHAYLQYLQKLCPVYVSYEISISFSVNDPPKRRCRKSQKEPRYKSP